MSRFRPFAVYIGVANFKDSRIMKEIINKTRSALAILAMLGQIITMSAQPAVYDMGIPARGKSLVREYNASNLITYSYPSFGFVDNTYSTVVYHDFDPDIEVYDMEICGDTLYFCGKNKITNLGVFGFVSISDLQNSLTSAGFTYNDVSCLSGINLDVISLFKLEVFKASTDIHVVMLGELECDYCDTNLMCILDAFTPLLNMSGTWDLWVVPGPSTMDLYTDIEVIDRFVVTVSQKYQSDVQIFRFFDRPTAINTSITSTMLYWTTYYTGYFAMTYQSHLMTSMYSNYFVSATIPTVNTISNQNSILLSLFDGQNLQDQYIIKFVADYDSACSIVDIKYDTDLYVVIHADIDGSGMGYYIIEIPGFPFSMPPTPYNVYAYRTNYQDAVHSLTPINNIPSHAGAIGEQSGSVILYRHELNTVSSNNCDDSKDLKFDKLPPVLYSLENELFPDKVQWRAQVYLGSGYEIPIKKQCEY